MSNMEDAFLLAKEKIFNSVDLEKLIADCSEGAVYKDGPNSFICMDSGCTGTSGRGAAGIKNGRLHCFRCDKWFDPISILEIKKGLSFMEGMLHLSEITGIELPRSKKEFTEDERREYVRQKRITEVLNKAAEFYHANLLSPSYAEAQKYLISRGKGKNAIMGFSMGVAGYNCLKELFPDYETNNFLIEAGLVRENENRERFDFFNNRIMFPFKNKKGDVVGFSGRVYKPSVDSKLPKYINSSASSGFDKSSEFFGWYQALEEIKKTRRALVVEGQFDVVSCHTSAFKNTIASSGASLSENQVRDLFANCDEIIFCFDSDYAGQGAALSAISNAMPLLTASKSVTFMRSPEGKDPDSFLSFKAEDMTKPKEVILAEAERRKTIFSDCINQRSHIHEVLVDLVVHKLRKRDNFDPSFSILKNPNVDPVFFASVQEELARIISRAKDNSMRSSLARSVALKLDVPVGDFFETVRSYNAVDSIQIPSYADVVDNSKDVRLNPVMCLASFVSAKKSFGKRSYDLINKAIDLGVDTPDLSFVRDLVRFSDSKNWTNLISDFLEFKKENPQHHSSVDKIIDYYIGTTQDLNDEQIEKNFLLAFDRASEFIDKLYIDEFSQTRDISSLSEKEITQFEEVERRYRASLSTRATSSRAFKVG